MPITPIFIATLLSSALALPQVAKTATDTPLQSKTTLPILFTSTVSADHSHVGDVVHAKTMQVSRLPSGDLIPAGTPVLGHIATVTPFIFDNTPYAKQQESTLSIHFDSVRLSGRDVPISVTVRAMADPLATVSAEEAKSTDLDSLGTLTLIGGAQLVPSQDKIVDSEGDVIAYNRRGGVYAHLIAHGGCTGGNNEVSIGIFSPYACGLYGFGRVTAQGVGSSDTPSNLLLSSTHVSPKVWRNSTALLEVLPTDGAGR
jgi:hypothetical protein